MSVERDKNVGDLKALATQIAVTCGPCQVLVLGSETRGLLRALWLAGLDARGHALNAVGWDSGGSLPFAGESFDAVVSFGGLESCTDASLPFVLAEIKRVTRRSVILFIDIDEVKNDSLRGRRGWEVACFNAGFRKHPLYYRSNDYASLERDGTRVFIPLEKVPVEAWARYPMDSLREERDLHMDMLRESGSRSDAHVGRYHFASRFIRPGDSVLDAACGLGYGSYVVRSETRARSFMGIDASEYGIDYARLNFGGEAISFRQGLLPECLAEIPDCSIDHVLCFETLEHVQDPVRLLAEFQRVLTPGGRLTCSVPHDWSDETGEDPNPFHFHVYDKERFVAELSRYFDLELLVGQTADRVKKPGSGCVWLKRPRSLTEIAVDQDEIEAEWLLAVAAKSPLDGSRVPYREHVFSADEQREAGNALAFKRDYSNPWLIRSMVSIGLRTENANLRGRWAEAVLMDSSGSAADRGAALCVLAYCALASGNEGTHERLLERIDGYLADVADESNPNVLRWRVSLEYVGGLLALSMGRRDVAKRSFDGVINAPVAQYSATLLTKPAEAAYLLGLLLAGEGRGGEAERIWWDAFRRISTSLGERLTQGYEARPAVFEIRELAATLALCGRLVAAAAQRDALAQRPGIFHDECHADSVFQSQSFAAVEQLLADLRRDFLDQQTGLDQLERGKKWLEQQWSGLQQEVRLRDDELSRLSGAKDWLETQTESLQAELLRQRHVNAEALEAVKVLEEGKAWLEAQWRISEAEREHLQQAVATLEAGKTWLETQWKAGTDALGRKSTEFEQLLEGKRWLEDQWEAAKAELTTLAAGKDWLESQWKIQAVELDARRHHVEVLQSEVAGLEAAQAEARSRIDALSTDNARLGVDLKIARDKAAQLKQSRFFRLARKLGLFDFF